MKTTKAILILAAALLLFYPVSSKADTMFDLVTPNTAIQSYAGPYAHVVVHLNDATHATITFTSLTNSGNIYLMGDGSSAAVNVNGSFTLGTITGSNAGTGFDPGPFSNGGSGNVSTFGVFNLTINDFDGFSHSVDTLSFMLTKNSGTWASSDAVLIANAVGNTVAAHIFVTSSPANKDNGALATGFASDGVGISVPEPGILILLGIAMSAIGAASWRIRKL